jgi:hypothetical protein
MSHVSTVQVQIKDLECLAKAAERCGLEFKQDQKSFRWFGRWMDDYSDAGVKALGIDPKTYGQCEHALSVKDSDDAYEVGIVRNPKGEGYILLFDFWNGGHGLMQHISEKADGVDANKLKQFYAAEVAKKQLRRQGRRFVEKVVDGKIHLIAS